MSARGIFVTGTDTDIGKTMVSAWLVKSWQADYWKPVQSGCLQDSDTDTVRQVNPQAVLHPPARLLKAPLSPHEAAALEGVSIRLADFHLPVTDNLLVVEGAGGALVPLNDHDLMTDLMAHLGLPVLVVARSGLGTINHTLLTLEALRSRGLAVAGVVLNGPLNAANRQAIEHYGRVRVLGELPRLFGPEALLDHPAIGWTP
ncbi:MAG TPA: dethiobiotin synthase [Candidatus Sulfotelmatobacter sp.]|jgi:dethiobiotin synthetase/malonyl-CoA O-methyltransferase|nr:dethiobiotin synthase [Candidatus Sulfotelmatobacter sp.]